jgi:hypothetical protein
MGSFVTLVGHPVAVGRKATIKVAFPPREEAPAVMFARARRPGHQGLVVLGLLATVVAVYACAVMVVQEVARAETQVQAASQEYAAAGLKFR